MCLPSEDVQATVRKGRRQVSVLTRNILGLSLPRRRSTCASRSRNCPGRGDSPRWPALLGQAYGRSVLVPIRHTAIRSSMTTDPPVGEGHRALLKDLGTEYYALLGVVSDFDKRDVVIKGWSVTLSLASLGLGFQQNHYALFGLAAATATGFWILDAQAKRHQMRYYTRMRDIEVAASHVNRMSLGQSSVDRIVTSAPLADWCWGFPGKKGGRDWRDDPPRRRTADEVRRNLRRAPLMAHVALPHFVAVVLGLALLVGAIVGLPGLAGLDP